MIAAVFAQKRTGSTVFRKLLASGGALDAGEVFHGQAPSQLGFYPYFARRVSEDSQLAHPSYLPQVLWQFLEGTRRSFSVANCVIGVIDSDVMLFESRHAFDVPRPLLIQHLDDLGVRFVHVRRRNCLASLVSLAQAERTNLWSTSDGTRTDEVVVIPPESVLSSIEAMVRRDEVLARWLSTGSFSTEIAYEDMFTKEGVFSQRALELCQSVFIDQQFDSKPRRTKTGFQDLSRVVANWPDVCQALRGTPFEWMLGSTQSEVSPAGAFEGTSGV